MALSSRRLNYQDANNKTVIKLYTSLGDIYTGKGFPITYKGETVYAPIVPVNDFYGTPLRVSDSSGEYRIAYDTIGKTQQQDLSTAYYKYISGNTTHSEWYGYVTFVVPYATTVNIKSLLDAYIGHYDVKGDKWQVTYFDTYIDDNKVARYEFRQSQGEYRQWFTIMNQDLTLGAGVHTLGMYLIMDCSAKDSQELSIYQWKNTITLK